MTRTGDHSQPRINLVSLIAMIACMAAVVMVAYGVYRHGSHPLWVIPPLVVIYWSAWGLHR